MTDIAYKFNSMVTKMANTIKFNRYIASPEPKHPSGYAKDYIIPIFMLTNQQKMINCMKSYQQLTILQTSVKFI